MGTSAWYENLRDNGATFQICILTHYCLDVNDQVKDFLDGNGLIAPESSPELLCGGTSFRPFEWTDSVLEWDSSKGTETAREIDDSEVMISQVYDYDSESLPYLLQNNHKYYVVRDDLSPTNICNPLDTTKEPFLAHVFSGQAATRRTVMAQPVFIDGVSPLVVMCPAGLEKGSLSDLESKKGTRIIGETNINEINQEVPGPTTLFHELIHLTSFWAETDDGAFTKSDNYIKDYSCGFHFCFFFYFEIYNECADIRLCIDDAVKCLQMASTGIELTISDETKVYTPGDASLNAESYTFFALSYWYFMETDQTFYEGLLVNWDNETPEPEAVAKRSSVDGARPYRRWLGHSHDETRHY